MVKNLPAMQETLLWSLSQEDPLEKGMATHSSILAWRIPWTEEPGGLQSMGSQRVGHDWPINTHIHTHTHSFITLLDSPPEKWFIFFLEKATLFLFSFQNLGNNCLTSGDATPVCVCSGRCRKEWDQVEKESSDSILCSCCRPALSLQLQISFPLFFFSFPFESNCGALHQSGPVFSSFYLQSTFLYPPFILQKWAEISHPQSLYCCDIYQGFHFRILLSK